MIRQYCEIFDLCVAYQSQNLLGAFKKQVKKDSADLDKRGQAVLQIWQAENKPIPFLKPHFLFITGIWAII